jgi:uncharacterized protein YidB (DUF937 family)
MGLLDVLQGMSNGPRGAGAQPSGRSGISPLAMGLLALLAYKTMKGQGPLGGLFGHKSGQGTAPVAGQEPVPGQTETGGGLSSWLQSGLGGALAGGAAGNVISGGLGELLKRFEQNGLGGAAQSWVGDGPNQPVSASDVEKAAGNDTLDALAREIGMSRDQLVQRLSAELPQTVDRLTPHGQVPTPEEAAQSV